jgi:hypothetical protein
MSLTVVALPINQYDLEWGNVSLAVVTLAGVILALITYNYQKKRDHDLAVANDRLKRFEKLQDFEKRYGEESALVKVRKWIYAELHDSSEVPPRPSTYEMQSFMGFFEELAVMINSELMSEDLAAYTIGIDAARFYDTVTDYHADKYFRLFDTFALKMQKRFEKLTENEIDTLRF